MTRLVLIGLLLLSAAGASAQSSDAASVRRALAIDPFSLASYRFLTAELKPTERRQLADELARSNRFADQVLAARLQIDGGQNAEARQRLHAATVSLPDDLRALDAFTQLALGAGAYADANVSAKRALGKGRTAQRVVTTAITELRQGRRAEGLALLVEARTLDPTGGATDSAIDALLGQRMTSDAAELLRAELDPKSGAKPSPSQWRRLADLERQLGRMPEASSALLHALDGETSPTGRRALAQTVMHLYRDKKQLPELVRSLKDAKTGPRLVLRGDVEAELGHAALAAEAYEAAAKVDPNDSDASLRLATTAKNPADRAARYAVLVAAHPGELRYALELADLRFAAKDDAGGKRALRDAAARLSSAPSAQDQIARRLVEHGDLPGALECRLRAARLDPRNSDYAIALGEAYRALGKRAEATAAYNDSIVRAGNARAAWDRAIDSFERASYPEEALATYAEARKRWPEDLALARRNAAAFERTRDYDKALATWKDIGKRSVRAFDQSQAKYNLDRLEQLKLTGQ